MKYLGVKIDQTLSKQDQASNVVEPPFFNQNTLYPSDCIF